MKNLIWHFNFRWWNRNFSLTLAIRRYSAKDQSKNEPAGWIHLWCVMDSISDWDPVQWVRHGHLHGNHCHAENGIEFYIPFAGTPQMTYLHPNSAGGRSLLDWLENRLGLAAEFVERIIIDTIQRANTDYYMMFQLQRSFYPDCFLSPFTSVFFKVC